MSFLDNMIARAKSDKKTIVLPESEDPRTIKAAAAASAKEIANIILVGDEDAVHALAAKEGVDVSACRIVNPVKYEKFSEYVNAFYELRKAKGVDMAKAEATMKDYVYFATMMVKLGEADGMVSGAAHSTADTVRTGYLFMRTAALWRIPMRKAWPILPSSPRRLLSSWLKRIPWWPCCPIPHTVAPTAS